MTSFHKDDNSVACNVFKMIMLFFYSVSRLCLDRYVNKTEVLMLKTRVGRPFSTEKSIRYQDNGIGFKEILSIPIPNICCFC